MCSRLHTSRSEDHHDEALKGTIWLWILVEVLACPRHGQCQTHGHVTKSIAERELLKLLDSRPRTLDHCIGMILGSWSPRRRAENVGQRKDGKLRPV